MLQGQAAYGSQRAQTDDGALAIGRNLFPTLPEDAFDRGPQSRAAFRLIADVRLDNRPELADRLGISRKQIAQRSDSALLFEAFLRLGEDAVDHLVGEFAFAFWDGAKQHLLLGRDILGLRPLYFHRGKDFFAFASMPGGLHALDGVPYDFDPQFMAESLALLPPTGSACFFRGIERVEPGQIVRVTREGVRSHKYWRPPGPSKPHKSPQDYEEGQRWIFDQAVKAQLRGAGDIVASHLSAGLDSSTVAATAARLLPAGKILAFTAVPRRGFAGRTPPGTIADEGELAAATARLYPNIEHILVENRGDSPLAALDRSFFYQQQPAANLSNGVWGRAIHRAARARGASVILKGAVGNMSISYSGLDLLPSLLARGDLVALSRHLLGLARNGVPVLALGAQTLRPFLPGRLWRALRRMGGRVPGPLDFSAVNLAKVPELVREDAAARRDEKGRPCVDPFDKRLLALSRGDHGGNAYKGVLAEWGLSVRDPTADKRVIEFGLATPPEEFVRGGVPRSLARRAFADRLPPEITAWKLRGYQSADWYEAVDRARGEFEEEVAAIARCAEAGEALDISWLQNALDAWPKDNWESNATTMRYRLGLTRGISAGHFMRKVRGTN